MDKDQERRRRQFLALQKFIVDVKKALDDLEKRWARYEGE